MKTTAKLTLMLAVMVGKENFSFYIAFLLAYLTGKHQSGIFDQETLITKDLY